MPSQCSSQPIFCDLSPTHFHERKILGCPNAEVCGQVHKARALVHSEHITCLVSHCCSGRG